MAKMMKNEAMMCSGSRCSPKCLVMTLLAAIFASASLWMLVRGVMMEWNLMPWNSVLLWFIGGFILLGIAKKCKCSACSQCSQ